jgi:hypothetical protein
MNEILKRQASFYYKLILKGKIQMVAKVQSHLKQRKQSVRKSYLAFEHSVSHTSGNISAFLPAAISNAYIFMSAVTAYAFKKRRKKKIIVQ